MSSNGERYSLEQALDEAEKLKSKVGSGEAATYAEAEYQLEHQKKVVTVENSELDVAYDESIITLPKHRQEKFGITQIRSREVTRMPAELYEAPEYKASDFSRRMGTKYMEGEELRHPLHSGYHSTEEYDDLW